MTSSANVPGSEGISEAFQGRRPRANYRSIGMTGRLGNAERPGVHVLLRVMVQLGEVPTVSAEDGTIGNWGRVQLRVVR
jgi:hypothetical protein